MKANAQKQGQLRIIGGQWRSRRINFIDGAGLRPTPDRVRETLFNWLAPYIEGAHVLDLFTGSGALFFEALSRGASKAVALDTNPQVIRTLQEHLKLLNSSVGQPVLQSAIQFLQQQSTEIFDVVFLDPPFHQNMLQESCQLLENNNWLAKDAWIYTESEMPSAGIVMPATWQLHREKKAGQVYYALWHRSKYPMP